MCILIKELFEKKIDRPIEGVIKADDLAELRNELEEYVITDEIAKQLENFMDAYTNYHVSSSNGVWISGFFGSGKSHLLKMLALLLENKQVDGIFPLDIFKEKCADKSFLKGKLQLLPTIPTKSILFNVDQKADIISKKEVDALLAVFVKVFNDMCGYYGKQPHIAQFERYLDSRELFTSFQAAYFEKSGKDWDKGREQYLFESSNIAFAYSKVTGDNSDTTKILDKFREEYTLSIEDFAEQVRDYIEKQDNSKFRLNFFVDEVGQYIAGNIKLMTNLQTIAESLATKCKGRAWLIVTAQEDMDSIIGEMNTRLANDFSKIQARFGNRLKLTSANVAEVIQKRLLLKNENSKQLVLNLYNEQHNNFRTLFDFVDGAQKYKNYGTEHDFINGYPFIPYQFDLFQTSIKSLSTHNAFEGYHNSVGERSMLGVFQQVLKYMKDERLGAIPTFDFMFEGIRSTLRSAIQSAIIMAEKNLDNEFAVKILKALFLVKYVASFKATSRNICVLMQASYTQDATELARNVQESLNILEQQTYIQRSGDIYEYLTSKEKDIEQEIKHVSIDNSSIIKFVEETIFSEFFGNKKIRYSNQHDYPFSPKIDGNIIGRENELAIHIVTPRYDKYENGSALLIEHSKYNELLVRLNAQDRLMLDIVRLLQTKQYVYQKDTNGQEIETRHILNEKSKQNAVRRELIKEAIHEAIISGTFFAKGQEIFPAGSTIKDKIENGFKDLITKTYIHLSFLSNIAYTESQIKVYLQPNTEGVLLERLNEAEQEVLSVLYADEKYGIRTSIKSLCDKFEKIPYGWQTVAILCMVAKLYSYGKIEVIKDGNSLVVEELEQNLINSRLREGLTLIPLKEYTQSQVRALKEFYQEFLGGMPTVTEANALAKNTLVKIKEMIQELDTLLVKSENYPFAEILSSNIDKVKTLVNKPSDWFLTGLQQEQDDFLDIKENVLDPIKQFFIGQAKTAFDNARELLSRNQPNLSFIDAILAHNIEDLLLKKDCYKGNYVSQLNDQCLQFQIFIDKILKDEREKALLSMRHRQTQIENEQDYINLKQEDKSIINQHFINLHGIIGKEVLIAVIREKQRNFEEVEYIKILSQLADMADMASKEQEADTPPASPNSNTQTDGTQTNSEQTNNDVDTESGKGNDGAKNPSEHSPTIPPVAQTKKIEYIPRSAIKVSYTKAYLSNETDLDEYLNKIREAYLNEIQQGKRVQV